MVEYGVESEAELCMEFEDEVLAELILRSLQPDNEPLPRGLAISVRRDGSKVIFRISSQRPVSSLLATIDDIIVMTLVALRSIRAVSP